MARGVNKVILLGNVGQDPEVRHTPGGDMVCTLSVATSEQWTDKRSNEKREATEWHRCVVWRRLAEIVAEYVHKGDQLYLEGKLKTRKWQDQSGQDRYTTEIQVNELQLIGGKRNSDRSSGAPHSPQDNAGQHDHQNSGGSAYDDDVPFGPYMRGSIA